MITLLGKRSVRHVLGEGEGKTKAKAEMSTCFVDCMSACAKIEMGCG